MDGRALRTPVVVLLVAALVGTALSACGGGDDEDEEVEAPTTDAIYVAVLRHLDLPPDVDSERTTVYVVDLDDDPVSLDDQVTIIQELDGTYDVQFFDTLDAVTEIDDDGKLVPPGDGSLVVIGAPTRDGNDDLVTVRTELIRNDEDAMAWQLTLDGDTDGLRVVASNQTQPELLVDPAA